MRSVALWLSHGFVFVLPMEGVVSVPGLGRLSRIIGLLLAVSWLLVIAAQGRCRKPHPVHLVMFLFALWNGLSISWSLDPLASAGRFGTYLQLVALVFILWDLYATPADLRTGLQAYVLGCFASALSTYWNYLQGHEFYFRRYSGGGLQVNDLGMTLALALPIAWYLTRTEQDRPQALGWRIVDYAYVPAGVLAILLSASRSAALGMLPAFLFMASSLSRVALRWRVALVGASAACLLAVLPLVPEASFQRLADTGDRITQGNLSGRLDTWLDGLAAFSEHPILGVGSKAFIEAADETGHVAHNFALALLVELGIVGFSLYAVVLAMVVHSALLQPRWNRRLWLTVLAIWFTGAIVHNWEHRKPTWLFFGLVTTAAHLPLRRDEPDADPIPTGLGARGTALAPRRS